MILLKVAEPDDMLRTFPLETCANLNKLHQVNALFAPYRSAATKFADDQWGLFHITGKFDKDIDLIIKSPLNQRTLRCCMYQTVGILKGFLTNVKNAFTLLVMKHKAYSPQEKMYLNFINKYNKWFEESVSIRKSEIPQKYVLLAKTILKHLFKRFRKPQFNKINLDLNNNVAIIEEVFNNDKKHKATFADYWVNV